MKKVFEGKLELESVDDGGQARIATINEENPDPHEEMFVRVQSWDEGLAHKQFMLFEGKRVRVTVEVVE